MPYFDDDDLFDALVAEFENRIIPFDANSAQLWGTLLSGGKKDPHTTDKQIAAVSLN